MLKAVRGRSLLPDHPVGTAAALGSAVLLLAVPLAGCLTVDPGNPVTVPGPRLGSTYRFISDEGVRLNVTFLEETERRDRWGRSRPVLRAEWEMDRGPHTFRFWESADPGSGLVVQQVSRCGMPYDKAVSGGRDDRACLDERALVMLAGGGLPGAFGAAPFWGSQVDPAPTEAVDIDVRSLWTDDSIAYEAERRRESGRDCIELSLEREPTMIRTMPQSVVAGPFTLCTDIPVPVSFVTTDGTRFRLVDEGQGDGPRMERSSAQLPDRRPLDQRTWRDPFVVSEDDDSAFPPSEAHRYAMNESTEYRSFVEEGALIAGTHLYRSGSTEVVDGVVRTQKHERHLQLFLPGGRKLVAVLTKETGNVEPSEITLDRVTESSVEGSPNADTLAPEQTTLRSTKDHARQVIGTAPSRAGFGQWPSLPDHPWGAGAAERRPRTDGYTVVVWSRDPTPAIGNLQTPYQMVVDGPTGAVLWFTYNRSRLPYT